MRENSWLSYTDEDDKNVEVLAGEYKEFLSKCKTERECTEYFTKEMCIRDRQSPVRQFRFGKIQY